jgi:proteasome activator subunit 4
MSQLLELALAPRKMSPQLANLLFSVLTVLLRKDKGTTPLVIPWRRLLDLMERVTFPSLFPAQLLSDADDRLTKTVQTFVKKARRYFSPDVVPLIMEQFWAALVYPNHNEAEKALSILSLFLPNNDLSWIGSIVAQWPSIRDHHAWDNKILTLLARASKSSLGSDYVWDASVVDAVFSRVLTRLDITLGGSSKLVEGLASRPESSFYGAIGEKRGVATAFACWTVYALTPRDDDPVFVALERFLNTVETYFNPSNRGKWSTSLAAILSGLSRGLAERLSKQRSNKAHPTKLLRTSDVERIVKLLLKSTSFAM